MTPLMLWMLFTQARFLPFFCRKLALISFSLLQLDPSQSPLVPPFRRRCHLQRHPLRLRRPFHQEAIRLHREQPERQGLPRRRQAHGSRQCDVFHLYILLRGADSLLSSHGLLRRRSSHSLRTPPSLRLPRSQALGRRSLPASGVQASRGEGRQGRL
jgi:hypothetical protein